MSLKPFAVATPVRVRRDPHYGPGPWPDKPIGTITGLPIDGAAFKSVATLRGPQRHYWIVFDEPQRDGDGDGPYAAAEVEEEYIEALREPEADDDREI